MPRFDVGGFDFGGLDIDDSVIVFDDLTAYYQNLLIKQYATKPKAVGTVGVFVREFTASQIIGQVRDGFDLDTAVGVQLEMIAAYRGAVRNVYGIDLLHDYFSMPFYDDADPTSYEGYAFYDDVSVDGYSLFYADSSRPLYDDELRRLTKYLARVHSSVLTVKEIDDILFEFFGANVTLTDNEDMSITYTHNPADSDKLFVIVSQSGKLPKIAGVSLATA
jgi:hypothetical protein